MLFLQILILCLLGYSDLFDVSSVAASAKSTANRLHSAIRYETSTRVGHLSDLARKFQTDKVTHGYTEVYETLFAPIRSRVRKVLEIGVYFGSSIRMWQEFFPNAKIIGLDAFNGDLGNGMKFANAASFLEDHQREPMDRVELVVGSQGNRRDLVLLATRHLAASFDLILDDGSHRLGEQQESFATLFHLIRPGGYYIVEDMHSSWEFGLRDLADDGANSFVRVVERFIGTGVYQSQYTSANENEFLMREISSVELVYTNNNGSCTAIFRRAFPMSTPARPSRNTGVPFIVDGARRSVLLTSYATSARFDECARRQSEWGRAWSDATLVFSDVDFDSEFRAHAAPVLAYAFGGGYYVWKPHVIANALRTTTAEYVVYSDACSAIPQDVSAIIARMPPSAFLVAFELEAWHAERVWTKRDLLNEMSCTEPRCVSSPQICATSSIWRVGDARALAFAEQWLALATQEQLVTDSPSVARNSADWKQHRWDQSIFSVLVS